MNSITFLKKRLNFLCCLGSALVFLTGIGLINGCVGNGAQHENTSPLKLSIAPYPDTTLVLFADQEGVFKSEGIKLKPYPSNWGEQLELLVAGGVDVCMATLDEFVARERQFRQAGRPLVYFLPAWKFEGLSFAANNDIQTLSTLRKNHSEEQARKLFVTQLRGRMIAIPEHSVFDQAIRSFIRASGEDPGDFRFVNTSVEAGLNGLSDSRVALAAIGNNQIPEATLQGYTLTPAPADLGFTVLTGFATTQAFFEKHRDLLQAFARAWYKSVALGTSKAQERYTFSSAYLKERGAAELDYPRFRAALANSIVAESPRQALAMFGDPMSSSYWRKTWDATVENLKASGVEPPDSSSGFVAIDFLSKLSN